MRVRPLLAGVFVLAAAFAGAQSPPPGATPAVPGATKPGEDFRDTTAYRYPALSRTVRDMQNRAYAMQLRDYCTDDRVSDEFVKAQLERFSRITGRTETCRSLLAY